MENTFGWLYSVFVKAYRYETLTHEVFWIFWIFSLLLPLCHDWCLKVQLISRKLSISSTGGGILHSCKKTVTSIWRSSAQNIHMEILSSKHSNGDPRLKSTNNCSKAGAYLNIYRVANSSICQKFYPSQQLNDNWTSLQRCLSRLYIPDIL